MAPKAKKSKKTEYYKASEFKKITTIHELRALAEKEEKYKKFMFAASENLGGPSGSIQEAYNWLTQTALETGYSGVIDEINCVKDCVRV